MKSDSDFVDESAEIGGIDSATVDFNGKCSVDCCPTNYEHAQEHSVDENDWMPDENNCAQDNKTSNISAIDG